MRRLRNGITALLLFVFTCGVAACGVPTSGGQTPTTTVYVQPTVQIVTPTANQQLNANSGGVIAVPLDAAATGDGPLTFSWSDTLSLIGGYKSNQIIFAQPPTSFPCGPQPDTLTAKVADVHNQSVSAQVNISLQRSACASTPPPAPTATPHNNPPPAPTATNPPPPTVTITSPSAGATETGNSGGTISFSVSASTTGNWTTMTWSDTLGPFGGYKTPELITITNTSSLSCSPTPDTVKVTVKDSHGQSASASELIYLKAC
jgi:hypothetical protein